MNFADEYFSKGMETYLAREFEKAADWFSKALLENPENVNYYFYRGSSFQELEMYDKAADDYSNALKRLSSCIPIRFNRFEVFMKLGMRNLAEEDLDFIIEHANIENDEGNWLSLAYMNRGLLKLEAESIEEALIDLSEAEDIAKTIGDALLIARIADELERSGF